MVFPVVMYGCESYKEGWAMNNWCFQIVVLEKTLQSLLDCKEIKRVNPKGNQLWIFTGRTDSWSWSSNTLVTWWEGPTHWKRPWCRERLKAGGEAGSRERDGGIASPTQWTRIWANSRRRWRTEGPAGLQSVGLQRVRHDLATEQQAAAMV